MVIDNCFIPAAHLCVEMICPFLRRLSVWSMVNGILAAGYQYRRPARCPRLTLDQRRCRHVWVRTHRLWVLRHWRRCVFSDESRATQFHSDGCTSVHCKQGERPIDACIQPLDSNHGPSIMALDNRFIPAARLCVEMINRFLRRLSVWSIVNGILAAGFRSRHPARCPRWTVDHRRCHHAWGQMHTIWDLRHWWHCVVSDESRITQFHSDGCAHVQCRFGERPTDAWIPPLDGKHGPSAKPPPHNELVVWWHGYTHVKQIHKHMVPKSYF